MPVISRPSNMIWPEVGGISQVSILKKVDFPAPFGPMIPRSSPRLTEKSMLLLATRPPYRFVNPLARKIGLEQSRPAARRRGDGGSAALPACSAPAGFRFAAANALGERGFLSNAG